MSKIALFARYADAFEKAFESDDWKPIAPFFAPDATYAPGGGPFPDEVVGRDAILDYFKRVLDGFDRRFAHRTLALLDGPRESEDSVWIKGSAGYDAAGVPDIVFELEEEVWFRDGLITRIEDRYEPEAIREIEAFLEAHADTLGIVPVRVD